MSNRYKIFTGILSIMPIILFGVYIIMFITSMISIVGNADHFEDDPFAIFSRFGAIFIALICFALFALADLIFFLIHAINNKALKDNERIIWVLVFVFAGMIGYPIYWYMRIYKAELPTI